MKKCVVKLMSEERRGLRDWAGKGEAAAYKTYTGSRQEQRVRLAELSVISRRVSTR